MADNQRGQLKSNMESESIFKKLLLVLRRPVFTFTVLLIAVLCFMIYGILPGHSYKEENGIVVFDNPESFASSPDGWNAIVEDRDTIYCLDNKGELHYALEIDAFPYDNAEIIDVAFHSDNRLYCHIAAYGASSYLTDYEAIFEIDENGKVMREVLHYDYREQDNPPSRQTRISGIHLSEESLFYLYNESAEVGLIEVDLRNPQHNQEKSVKLDGFGRIVKCQGMTNGQFLVMKNNGEIGTISNAGTYALLCKETYDAGKKEGLYPYDVVAVNDCIYMLEGQKRLTLYKWQETEWKELLSVKETLHMSEDTDLYSYGLGVYDGQLALHMNESLYVLQEQKSLVPYGEGFELTSDLQWQIHIKKFSFLIGLCLFLLGIVLGIGNWMSWRLNILSKQLLSTIPIVLISLMVVIGILFVSMVNLNTEDILRETIAINEIAAAQFQGEELENLTSFQSVDDGTVDGLNKRLRTFTNGNRSGWSRNYNMAIFVRTEGEHFVGVAGSDGSNQFLANSFSTNVPIDTEFYENSQTYAGNVGYGEGYENLQLVLVTPIYKEDGSYDAIMVLGAYQDRLIQEIVKTGGQLLVTVVILMILLIAVIALVSAHNVKSLKQAKEVVAQVAGGDFTTRIHRYSKDEVGEICVGINDMANQLETYFREKSYNEQFYYKFVPEKFRELLHKEKFTDLALGDAQSEDLSILFCDIRAFSMNSEMMTARESFEFVNRIYGKAGPIIRKHNGFIDKYIGDAIMALFESADDAVAAGIELYQGIVLNPNAEEEFGMPSVKIGIGIHSGMARIGIVGEEERMSGTVISNTVNLSSRMEALTKRYGAGMIISKDTLDRMANPDGLSTRYLGMVQVAGVNEVAALYEVLECLEEEKRSNREQSKLQFREAVRLFHTGELEKALELFQRIENTDGEDKAPELYTSYIREKMKQGDYKHNVFCFENKQ